MSWSRSYLQWSGFVDVLVLAQLGMRSDGDGHAKRLASCLVEYLDIKVRVGGVFRCGPGTLRGHHRGYANHAPRCYGHWHNSCASDYLTCYKVPHRELYTDRGTVVTGSRYSR